MPYFVDVSWRATSNVGGASSSTPRSDQVTRVSILGFWEAGVKKLATVLSVTVYTSDIIL